MDLSKRIQRVSNPDNRSGRWVYFVLAQGTNMIKIGSTKNIKQRMHNLANMCPVPLVLLGCIDSNIESEGAVHIRFLDFAHHGEWHVGHESIFEYIESNCQTTFSFNNIFKGSGYSDETRALIRKYHQPDTPPKN